MTDSVYITVKEASEHLRMHENSVLRAINNGEIEAVTLAKKGRGVKKLIKREPFEAKFGKVGAL